MSRAGLKAVWTILCDLLEAERPIGEIEGRIYALSAAGSLEAALGPEAALDLIAFDFRRARAASDLVAHVRALATARHPLLWSWLCARRVAAGVLEGSVDVADGCQRLERLRAEDEEADVVPPCFAAWASELDDVPRARTRALWDPGALAEKLEKAKLYQAAVLDEARRLVDRLEPLIERCLSP
jgi:hypothetical protein